MRRVGHNRIYLPYVLTFACKTLLVYTIDQYILDKFIHNVRPTWVFQSGMPLALAAEHSRRDAPWACL